MSENMSIAPQVILVVVGFLSAISSGFLILVFLFKEQSRTFEFRLIILLFVYDFIYSFNITSAIMFHIISPHSDYKPIICGLQAAFRHFGINGSFFVTVSISWTFYTHFIRKKPIQTRNPIRYYFKLNIAAPLFFCILPVCFNYYQPAEPFPQVMCYVKLENIKDYTGIVLRSLTYYIPFILIIFFNLFTIFKVFRFFRQSKNVFPEQNYIRNILLYPIILFFCWIWVLVERVVEINENKSIDWLNQMDLIFSTLNGLLNSIVYGYISLNPFQYLGEDSDIDRNQLLQNSNLESISQNIINNEIQRDQYQISSKTLKASSESFDININDQQNDN